MRVHVRLFAAVKQRSGRETLELDLPAEATVADLRRALSASYPELAGLLPRVVFAVDLEYADDRTRLCEASEIACLPPVSGG